ncbi:hypothetical protein ACQ4LE_011111 [Meloidogyne hapla]
MNYWSFYILAKLIKKCQKKILKNCMNQVERLKYECECLLSTFIDDKNTIECVEFFTRYEAKTLEKKSQDYHTNRLNEQSSSSSSLKPNPYKKKSLKNKVINIVAKSL